MTTIHAVVGVHISVGNAATQTTEDLAYLLRELANDVEDRQNIADLSDRSITIRDYNGNTVGHLQVTGYREDEDEDESETTVGFPYKPGAF